MALAALAAGVHDRASRADPAAAADLVERPVLRSAIPIRSRGTWYYPREQPDYDETGIASCTGRPSTATRPRTARFYNAGDLTAAHRTLPMPVNVRVTNLDNGKSVVLRVNDRGPYAKGRIIDVSEQAAKLLGFYGQGTARVRVTYVARATRPDGLPLPSDNPSRSPPPCPRFPRRKS